VIDDAGALHHVAPAPRIAPLDHDRVAVAQPPQEGEVRVAVAAHHGVARLARPRRPAQVAGAEGHRPAARPGQD
jgi:hypothetical protein